jgi:hypothetical protein
MLVELLVFYPACFNFSIFYCFFIFLFRYTKLSLRGIELKIT